jgi:hypothetical protein
MCVKKALDSIFGLILTFLLAYCTMSYHIKNVVSINVTKRTDLGECLTQGQRQGSLIIKEHGNILG